MDRAAWVLEAGGRDQNVALAAGLCRRVSPRATRKSIGRNPSQSGTFSPRYALYPGDANDNRSIDDRAILVSGHEWEGTHVSYRFYRFDTMESLSESAQDSVSMLILSEFWRLLSSTPFSRWMETLFGRRCQRPVLEAHCMRAGHFIRPHSDARNGRSIGLFIYLSRGWTEPDGGALEVQRSDGRLYLSPFFNRAVLFDVEGHDSHEIRPLPHSRGLPRLSFGVWFHG